MDATGGKSSSAVETATGPMDFTGVGSDSTGGDHTEASTGLGDAVGEATGPTSSLGSSATGGNSRGATGASLGNAQTGPTGGKLPKSFALGW